MAETSLQPEARGGDGALAAAAGIDLGAILANAYDGLCVVGRDGRFVLYSPGLVRLTGYTREEVRDLDHLGALLVPDPAERALLEVAWSQDFADGEARERVVRLRHKDGRLRWCRFNVSRAHDHVVFNALDVTETHEAQETLRRSEEQHRTLVDNLGIGLYTLEDGERGTVSKVNPSLVRILGLESVDQALTSTSLILYADPADRIRLLHELRANQFRDTSTARFEVKLLRVCDRQPVWVQITATATVDEQGRFQRVDGAIEDITERKRAQEALRESEERFRSIFESAAVGMATIGPLGQILSANAAFCRFLGYTEDELRERTIWHITHPDDRDDSIRRCRAAMAEPAGSIDFEKRYVHKDGTVRWGRVAASWIREADGRPRIGVAMVQDMTDRRRMAEELLKVEKLRSLSVLAGGIAHDFNNVLTGILGSISVARLDLPPDHAADGPLAAAEKAATRARELTGQLQTFAKGGEPRKQTVDLSATVLESAAFCLRGSNVRWDAAVAPDLPAVHCDVGQMSQVFNNLFINAAQAMPRGGRVRVVVDAPTLDGAERLPLRRGRYVRVSVVDEGGGILPEHLDRIFDPFFSTKPHGTGLGLASAWSIVKKHDGHIALESSPGEGSSFVVWLPATAAPAQRTDARRRPWAPGRGRLLVMDDQEDVRTIARHILGRAGYDVVAVEDGDAALVAWRSARAEGRPFAGAVMDLTVPGGRGGGDVVGELLAADPAARVIASSGYSTTPVAAAFRDYGFTAFVPKPYTADELVRAVQAALSGPAGQDEAAPSGADPG